MSICLLIRTRRKTFVASSNLFSSFFFKPWLFLKRKKRWIKIMSGRIIFDIFPPFETCLCSQFHSCSSLEGLLVEIGWVCNWKPHFLIELYFYSNFVLIWASISSSILNFKYGTRIIHTISIRTPSLS